MLLRTMKTSICFQKRERIELLWRSV